MKASSEQINVGIVRINRPSRKRGECAGLWKCAAIARIVQISARNAATGCMTSIGDSEFRVPAGREKSSAVMPLKLSTQESVPASQPHFDMQHTHIIANANLRARVSFTETPYAKFISLVASYRYRFDHRHGDRGQKE